MNLSLRRIVSSVAAGVVCAMILPVAPGPGSLHAQPMIGDEASLELAREELRTGRYWHAAEVLEELLRGEGLEPPGMLLLAEARAGYHDWPGVQEVLEGNTWLDELAPVRGHELLGRAYEAAGNWDVALDHFRRAMEHSEAPTFPLVARRIRAELKTGGVDLALAALDREADRFGALLPFLAWELAGEMSDEGNPAAVTALVSRVQPAFLRQRTAELLPRAVLAAGDSVRAEELYRAALGQTSGGVARSYRYQVAELILARGDTAEAWSLYHRTLEEASRSGPGMRSAARLVDLGGLDRDGALLAARALDRAGDGRRALAAYDLYVELSRRSGEEPDVWARVERARLASTVSRRMDEAVEEFRALDEHPDPAIGSRVLDVWTGLRRRQGQTNNVRILRRWLVERYPDTDQAAQVVFLRGDYAQDLQDWPGAIGHYRQVTTMAPTRSLAGLAWMRIGQIHLHLGDDTAALEAYRGYLERFPNGRRWAEASFWAGHILMLQGDSAAAAPHLERVLADDGLSYYAAESARLLDQPFPWEIGPGPVTEDAVWVANALETLDLLEAAGLEASARLHVERVVERADADGPSAQYPLGEGLIRRGWTIEGINRGWALVRAGEARNPRLLALLFPFPEREMVEREAEEYGVDPLLMAALIRQESAWDRDIVSSAGAIGLMQVMPPTGRELARAVGPRGFTTESLETAEVNLHLGGRFLRDMLDRYGPELPLVLSAYNAGPTRARRWSSFPEVGDRLRFTERIPFTETRGYVKNVTRNVAIYRSLYGSPSSRSAENQ